MNADVIQEKTAVFSFGSLSRTEEPRLYDLDEPTRELPLIAGRFAGGSGRRRSCAVSCVRKTRLRAGRCAAAAP